MSKSGKDLLDWRLREGEVTMDNGKPLHLDAHALLSINHWRDVLTSRTICDMFGLSDIALQNVLRERYQEKISRVLVCLASKPEWHDTGEPVPIRDHSFWIDQGCLYSYDTLRKKLKAQVLEPAIVDKMHGLLTGDEVKYQER